jgi:asparagine synthase (glutamine-hydrolysing)
VCGIAGWVGALERHGGGAPEAILDRMTDALAHRGPDDRGVWLGDGVALGHRRLSVIDIAGGHQPMWSADGRLGIVYNGEIYNFLELREELERKGRRFTTRSDTEVLLAAYEEWGEAVVTRLNGMFAFAIWDTARRRLFAARDRAGEKPFYYADAGGSFVFGSEIKALLPHPAVSRELDRAALARYLAFEYIPAPASIFRAVRKLPAAHTLSLEPGTAPRIERYWMPRYGRRRGAPSLREACEMLRERLIVSLRGRLISDVPLGVFLSGGIDSSTIVALLAREIGHPRIKTFSIGFHEASFDESGYARQIAEHFGTEHHQELLDPRRMVAVLPDIIDRLDEPFADPSIVPTYLLSRFTRHHVTVAVGGDGGDELFAGYPTFTAHKLARVYDRLMPRFVHAIVRGLAARLFVSHRNMSFDFLLNAFLKGAYQPAWMRHVSWTGAFTPEMQQELWADPPSLELEDVYGSAARAMEEVEVKDDLQRALQMYFKLYLQDDILTKVDRASMMNSLEVRAPFLDVPFMEAAHGLPARLKMRGLRGLKYVLKQTVKDCMPEEILARPKKGFGIPVSRWFREELRDDLLDTLDPERLRAGGLFRPEPVQRMVREHLRGDFNHRKPLWTLFMFEKWRERWGV